MKFAQLIIVIFLSIPLLAISATLEPESPNFSQRIAGGPVEFAKSAVDTVLLIGPHGSGALHNGQFETASGNAHWQGWTGRDMTMQQENDWHVSDYHAEGLNGHGAGNNALWCGSLDYPACNAGDEDGGYGNNYLEVIEWYGTVSNPGQPCVVSIDAWLNTDLEPGYDYLTLQAVFDDGSFTVLYSADGENTNHHLQETLTYQPGQYVGGASNQILLRMIVDSDESYSDEDCSFSGVGACQIDDIRVQLDNGGVDSFSDFEDGTMGDWQFDSPQGVGDFSKIWTGLSEIDPCSDNYSPQVAFIDDGIVVPGTGGTFCIDHCYGPNANILNNTGGLLGIDHFLDNRVLSPVMDVSSLGTNGYLLEFDVYYHAEFQFEGPGIFTQWHFRSTESANASDIENAPWIDLTMPLAQGYSRQSVDISQDVVLGARHMQIAFGVMEQGIFNGGANGTPAPYLDNVRVSAFSVSGPSITTEKQHLAQDGFPANRLVNLNSPEDNSVRFDMAHATDNHPENVAVAGDSLVAVVIAQRLGSILHGNPQLNYRLLVNPVFDAYRTSGLPSSGTVDGWQIHQNNGEPLANRFAFDLPDTGFLFPGDVLHYYISATDNLTGDIQTSIIPADTTGFSNWDNPQAYDMKFVMRALPAVENDGGLLQSASILFWDDSGKESNPQWYSAFLENGLVVGENIDVFYTANANSQGFTGLGQQATLDQLAGYSTILYTSGDQDFRTMGFADVRLISQWLELEDKHLFATGDNLMMGLRTTLPVGLSLLTDGFGVDVIASEVRLFINNQSTPLVMADAGNPVFDDGQTWVALGGCPSVKSFDAVMPLTSATRLISFTNQAGNPDFDFSAATLCQNQGTVISLPYAFEHLGAAPNSPGNVYGISSRAYLLRQALDYFGHELPIIIADTPDAVRLHTVNHPNPFNPSTTIEFLLPGDGHLSVKVFDVRGNLVRTLVDEHKAAGAGQVVWNGTNGRGGEVSSGVYFYEVRTGGEVRVQKMALVK